MSRNEDMGDGPPCPETPSHGKTYVLKSGRLWCPTSQAIYGPAEWDADSRSFVAGAMIRPPEVKPQMGTVPEPKPQPPSKSSVLREQTESAVRTVIAGSEVGAVRRITLYALTFGAIASTGDILATGIAGVALLFLAVTDRLA